MPRKIKHPPTGFIAKNKYSKKRYPQLVEQGFPHDVAYEQSNYEFKRIVYNLYSIHKLQQTKIAAIFGIGSNSIKVLLLRYERSQRYQPKFKSPIEIYFSSFVVPEASNFSKQGKSKIALHFLRQMHMSGFDIGHGG